ncbi:hypothetical protein KY343_06165 [Candidatus Woesearchaeota archaeon]|nr:hypothetical protein [Candidatus Woesearchaeota archaeon]
MEEDTPGSSRTPSERKYTEDAKKYERSTCSFDFYISKNEKQLMIKVTEYHPGLLHLTKSDLEEFIKRMEEAD